MSGWVVSTSRITRAPLPAGGTVTLNHSGGYVVYYEGPGANSGQIPSFTVRIAAAAPPAAGGGPQTYVGSVNYAIGGPNAPYGAEEPPRNQVFSTVLLALNGAIGVKWRF